MKLLPLISLSLLFFFTIGCDSDSNEDSGSKKDLTFKEQSVQGKIENRPFTFAAGYAEKSIWNDTTTVEINLFRLPPAEGYQPWDYRAYPDDCDEVFFTRPDKEALYTMTESWSFIDPLNTVMLYGLEGTGVNISCNEGAVEIISIDETSVTGRVAAYYDSENFINGSFTVPFKK